MIAKQMTVAEWEQSWYALPEPRTLQQAVGHRLAQPIVVRFSTAHDVPAFEFLVEGHDQWYDIELRKCDTPTKVVHWIAHLLGKSWITTTHLDQFIAHARHHVPGVAEGWAG